MGWGGARGRACGCGDWSVERLGRCGERRWDPGGGEWDMVE